MSCQEVAFANGTCRIEIEQQPAIVSGGSCVARMWLVDDAGVASALVLGDGEPAEIHGETEALTLSSAVTYLESRLGALSEYAHPCPDMDTAPVGRPVVIDHLRT